MTQNFKETVRKAMLECNTKNEMYEFICDELKCSRDVAKVLVSCFIWECSEAYMQFAITEGLSMFLTQRFNSDESINSKSDILENTVYVLRHISTNTDIGAVKVVKEIKGVGYECTVLNSQMTHLIANGSTWIVKYDGYIVVDGKADFKLV